MALKRRILRVKVMSHGLEVGTDCGQSKASEFSWQKHFRNFHQYEESIATALEEFRTVPSVPLGRQSSKI